MPELVPVLDSGGTIADRGTPYDPLGMDLPALSFPACVVPTGQILPELAASLLGRIDPRIHGFCTDSHPWIVTELGG